MGFEPTRAEHIGLAVQRLNHSATSSVDKLQVNVVRSFTSTRLGSNCIPLFDQIWTGRGRAPKVKRRDKP